jgi:hypothetical protein
LTSAKHRDRKGRKRKGRRGRDRKSRMFITGKKRERQKRVQNLNHGKLRQDVPPPGVGRAKKAAKPPTWRRSLKICLARCTNNPV